MQHELDHLDGVMYIDKVVPGTLSWLIEGMDEDGEETVLLDETTPEEVREAYKQKRLPSDVHISDMMRARFEKPEKKSRQKKAVGSRQ